jgi:hypothetical protein
MDLRATKKSLQMSLAICNPNVFRMYGGLWLGMGMKKGHSRRNEGLDAQSL